MGCWLVQNPRSNRGNRVGYPSALRESGHVALGSDGYPSDMQAEHMALLEDAACHGDPIDAARYRAQAGFALLAERFGGHGLPSFAPNDRSEKDFNALRAEAGAEAQRLWSRMIAL
jgi:hypothetical protein